MTRQTRLYSRRATLGLIATASLSLASAVRAETSPSIHVSKDPNCGCCNGWVAHLRRNGFAVSVTDTADVSNVKARLGVPAELASCHTAEIAGYVIEGHVPAQAITRLLAERPDALGLAVPGMPIGSPGMEGGTQETYDVILFSKHGQRSFGHFRGDRQI